MKDSRFINTKLKVPVQAKLNLPSSRKIEAKGNIIWNIVPRANVLTVLCHQHLRTGSENLSNIQFILDLVIIKHVKMTDNPKHTGFYQIQLTRLKIVQVKITGPVHLKNAEMSKFSWYFFVYIEHTVLIGWRTTKVAHI